VAHKARGKQPILVSHSPTVSNLPNLSADGSRGPDHHLKAFYDHFHMQILSTKSPPHSDLYQQFRGHQLLHPII